MRVTVHRTYTINWDGTPEDYVRLAHKASLENLDSLDCGDATGFFLELEGNPGVLTFQSQVTGNIPTLIVTHEDDLFQYDNQDEVKAYGQLTEDQLVQLTQHEVNIIRKNR